MHKHTGNNKCIAMGPRGSPDGTEQLGVRDTLLVSAKTEPMLENRKPAI